MICEYVSTPLLDSKPTNQTSCSRLALPRGKALPLPKAPDSRRLFRSIQEYGQLLQQVGRLGEWDRLSLDDEFVNAALISDCSGDERRSDSKLKPLSRGNSPGFYQKCEAVLPEANVLRDGAGIALIGGLTIWMKLALRGQDNSTFLPVSGFRTICHYIERIETYPDWATCSDPNPR
jgi:hypothetical protein